MTKHFMFQTTYLKIYSTSCGNTHHDVITFEIHGMVQNIKKLNIWRMENVYEKMPKLYIED